MQICESLQYAKQDTSIMHLLLRLLSNTVYLCQFWQLTVIISIKSWKGGFYPTQLCGVPINLFIVSTTCPVRSHPAQAWAGSDICEPLHYQLSWQCALPPPEKKKKQFKLLSRNHSLLPSRHSIVVELEAEKNPTFYRGQRSKLPVNVIVQNKSLWAPQTPGAYTLPSTPV